MCWERPPSLVPCSLRPARWDVDREPFHPSSLSLFFLVCIRIWKDGRFPLRHILQLVSLYANTFLGVAISPWAKPLLGKKMPHSVPNLSIQKPPANIPPPHLGHKNLFRVWSSHGQHERLEMHLCFTEVEIQYKQWSGLRKNCRFHWTCH